jgi:CBS domain-containing protein
MHAWRVNEHSNSRASSLEEYLKPVFTATADERVRDVRLRLGELDGADQIVDRVAIVGGDGELVADLSMLELASASPDATVSQLLPHVSVSAVSPDEEFSEAVWALLESQQGSIVVVDRDRRPIGRVFAIDVVAEIERRRHHPWARQHHSTTSAEPEG